MAKPKSVIPPEVEAMQRTMAQQQSVRALKKDFIPGPNGVVFPLDEEYLGAQYPMGDAAALLYAPEKYLRSPNPDLRYVWRRRNDRQTTGWVRCGWLRPVHPDEMDPTQPGGFWSEERLDDNVGFVLWGDMCLFEAQPPFIEQFYDAPEAWAKKRLVTRPLEVAQEFDANTGGRFRAVMTVKKS